METQHKQRQKIIKHYFHLVDILVQTLNPPRITYLGVSNAKLKKCLCFKTIMQVQDDSPASNISTNNRLPTHHPKPVPKNRHEEKGGINQLPLFGSEAFLRAGRLDPAKVAPGRKVREGPGRAIGPGAGRS